jgi:hypothetical protein
MPELTFAALGSLGTVVVLVLWFRADVLTRVEFDGEIRVRPKVRKTEAERQIAELERIAES